MAKLALPQVAVPRIERPSALTVPLQVMVGVPLPPILPLTESWLPITWPLRSEKLGEGNADLVALLTNGDGFPGRQPQH
jgi:hypothetical protein